MPLVSLLQLVLYLVYFDSDFSVFVRVDIAREGSQELQEGTALRVEAGVDISPLSLPNAALRASWPRLVDTYRAREAQEHGWRLRRWRSSALAQANRAVRGC